MKNNCKYCIGAFAESVAMSDLGMSENMGECTHDAGWEQESINAASGFKDKED